MLLSLDGAATHLEQTRRAGDVRVAWTNGCFDLLHAGHVALLKLARSEADLLVVGVNSDESVARLKGPTRPVCQLADRVAILDELQCVDVVLVLGSDVPTPEIARLRPDVCFKDDSYASLPMPERATVEGYGGTVRLVPRVGQLSTTATIARIADRERRSR